MKEGTSTFVKVTEGRHKEIERRRRREVEVGRGRKGWLRPRDRERFGKGEEEVRKKIDGREITKRK